MIYSRDNLATALERKEKQKDEFHKNLIKLSLPEQCKNCSFLEITNLRKHKVHCPYLVNRCILK